MKENEIKKDEFIKNPPNIIPIVKYIILFFKTKELRRKEFSKMCIQLIGTSFHWKTRE